MTPKDDSKPAVLNHDAHKFVRFVEKGADESRIEMGGQAVIEGVLMRSRTGYAVALRRDDDSIIVRQVPYTALNQRIKVLKLPVLRGFVALFEMLAIGTRALQWSAEEFEESLKRSEKKTESHGDTEAQRDHDDKQSATASTASADSQSLPRSPMEAFQSAGFAATVCISLLLVIVMMVIAPNLLALVAGKLPFIDAWAKGRGTLGFTEENHPFAYNIASGMFRALIVFGYVWAISLSKDIRRVFEYHGAEHKAVLAFEEGREVTVANAQRHDTLHPRCGTTFIAVVVLVSIIVFALIGAALVAWIGGYPDWPFLLRKLVTFGSHIAALPLVAGIAFELMKFCARRPGNILCALFLWPGYKFQRLTTRPPDDRQVEVAIVAMLAALAVAPDQRDSHQYVVRGLHDDESAPGYRASDAEALQEAIG